MEENMNMATELENTADWEDIDLEDVETGEEAPAAEADQPDAPEAPAEGEAEADQPDAQPEAESTTEAPEERFQLKHLDEVRNVSREEVIALAQKGMDYDRIRQKLENNEFEGFVNELAQDQGLSPQDFMDETRAQALARREDLDMSIARERVKLSRREKALEARERAKADAEAGERQKQAEIQDFLAQYKDVDPKDIPREVWVDVSRGESLVNAYRAHEARQLKAENESLRERLQTLEKNQENREKSTGSQRSAGMGKIDPIDQWWYGDDD